MPFLLLVALLLSSTPSSALSPLGPDDPVDFTPLPACVSDHVSFTTAAAAFNCAGPISHSCICGSTGAFPWGASCPPDSRYVIEQWFRTTCPGVSPVGFDPLPNVTRDILVLASMQRGCYAMDMACFCGVEAVVALGDAVAAGEPGASKARKWYAGLCGVAVPDFSLAASSATVLTSAKVPAAVPVTVSSASSVPALSAVVSSSSASVIPPATPPTVATLPPPPPPPSASPPPAPPSPPSSAVPPTLAAPLVPAVPSLPTVPIPPSSSVPTPVLPMVLPTPPTTPSPPASPPSATSPTTPSTPSTPSTPLRPPTSPTPSAPHTPPPLPPPSTRPPSTPSISTTTATITVTYISPSSTSTPDSSTVVPISNADSDTSTDATTRRPCVPKSAVSIALDRRLLFAGPRDAGAFFAMVFFLALGSFMLVVAGFEWLSG